MRQPGTETLPGSHPAMLDRLAERIFALPKDGKRRLVALAGAPASGKSFLSASLADRVRALGRAVSVIPMDGFHLDNRLLDLHGLRSRKGAPETFDASGFIAFMRRIKEGDDAVYPLFDRTRDLAIAGAAQLRAECDIAIIEGNYLLFDEAPWRELMPFWDLSIWLDEPEAVLRERLIRRWLDHDHTTEEAQARAEGNDIPNCRRMLAARLPADVIVAGSN